MRGRRAGGRPSRSPGAGPPALGRVSGGRRGPLAPAGQTRKAWPTAPRGGLAVSAAARAVGGPEGGAGAQASWFSAIKRQGRPGRAPAGKRGVEGAPPQDPAGLASGSEATPSGVGRELGRLFRRSEPPSGRRSLEGSAGEKKDALLRPATSSPLADRSRASEAREGPLRGPGLRTPAQKVARLLKNQFSLVRGHPGRGSLA